MFLRTSVRRAVAYVKRSLTLVFSITPLDLLMNVLLHISLEDSGSSWFVETGSLQDMSSINPIV